MPEYRYKAIDDNGKPHKGTMAADNETHLEEILNKGGYYLLEAAEVQAIVKSAAHKPDIVDPAEEGQWQWGKKRGVPPGVTELHLHQHVYPGGVSAGQEKALPGGSISFGGGRLAVALVVTWLTPFVGLINLIFLYRDKQQKLQSIIALSVGVAGWIVAGTLRTGFSEIEWLAVLKLGLTIWMTVTAIKAYKQYG